MPAPEIGGVDDERVVERFHSLVEIYEDLPAEYLGSSLNQPILLNCVLSYFQDIDRLKQYHKLKLADGVKKSAFTLKWIVRTRPIQLLESMPVTEQLLIANEVFAIRAALPFLQFNECEMSEHFFNLLLYTLRYRPLDEGVLQTVMYLLEKSLQGNSP